MAKRKKPNKKSPLSHGVATQFLLTVGDEGAILVYMRGRRVVRRMYASTPAPEDTKVFSEVLAQDTSAPITVLMDVMDQSYVQQSLPPVSAFSISKLINRRLERDFPAEDIKGALPLGRSQEGRKDWNYLFVSLANIPPASDWVDFALRLPNHLKGIYLLPVETQQIVKMLFASREAETHPAPGEWQLVVSHNKVGGFRQVVLKDGKLIFTRLAQPIGEAIPEVIAGNIEQEIQNTVEYLKRLGFRENATLDLFIVVAEDIKQVIDVSGVGAHSAEVLTPYDVSQRLRLENAALPQDHYGDVVLTAGFGVARKRVLRLMTPVAQKLELLFTASRLSRIAAGILIPCTLAYVAFSMLSIVNLQGDIDDAVRLKAHATQQVAAIKEESVELPYDMRRVNDVSALYHKVVEHDVSPLTMLADAGATMNDTVRVDRLVWEGTDFVGKIRTRNPNLKYKMTYDVTFHTPSRQHRDFIQNAETFFADLRSAFPEYEISHSRLPGTLRAIDALEQRFDDESQPAEEDTVKEFVTVQVLVEGPNAQPGNPGGRGR